MMEKDDVVTGKASKRECSINLVKSFQARRC